MAGSHIGFAVSDVKEEQREIDRLIQSLLDYKPEKLTPTVNKDSRSPAARNPSTPKVISKPGRGRPPKNRQTSQVSSPSVSVDSSECTPIPSMELVIECLNRLNDQNKTLLNRVAELDTIVQEQTRKFEDIQSASEPRPSLTPSQGNSSTDVYAKVVERVEKIEENINSHLLLCRGPAIETKIIAATVNGKTNVELLKAEICREVCGPNISQISVGSVSLSIFGKERKALKIECTNSNIRDYLLELARSRKPRGIYLVEFLSSSKLKNFQRLLALKRNFPTRIKAVYSRKGDIYGKLDPGGYTRKFTTQEEVDTIEQEFASRPLPIPTPLHPPSSPQPSHDGSTTV